MAQMTDWTDERDGKHWVLVIRHDEHPTAISLEFTSKSERRAVMVASDIRFNTLTDHEIRDLLDRARIIHRFADSTRPSSPPIC